MIVDYAPRFVETEEEKKLDRSVPLWQPMSPFPIQTDLPPAPKAPNPAFARFSKLLPDVPKIAHSIIQDNFDYTQALVVEASVDQLVDWAPNVLTFVADHRFLGMRPFARQAEMLIRLFEEWCPRCSSKDWFKEGFPVGATLEQIQTNVAMMDEGVCPHCGFTKAEGRIQGMFADPEELVAVIGQRGGKCVSFDAEFFDGEKRRIVGEAVDTDFFAVSKTKEERLAYRPATAFASGTKDAMKMTLADGSALTLSYDHRVYTPTGWVEAGQLKVGDLVATPRFIPEPKTPLGVSDDEVILAAYLLSDGGVSGSSTRFTNATPCVVADFTSVANKLSDGTQNLTGGEKLSAEDVEMAHTLRASGASQSDIAKVLGVTQSTTSLLLSGKRGKRKQKEGVNKEKKYAYIARGLSWFRRKWDIHGLAKKKRIPAAFWGLPSQQVALFLNRFWACDGYVTGNKVGVTLASEKLVDDLKFLLSRLGIRASKKYRVAKCQTGEFDAWRLTAAGRDAVRFLDVVGPVLGKEEACQAVRAKLLSTERNTTYDVVPIARAQIAEMADEVYQKTGRKCRYEMREFSSAKATGHISRDMLVRVCQEFGYDGKYAWMADTDLVWEAVEEVTPVGVIPVYDLSVPETECFVTNNMVVHNSAVSSMGISYLTHLNCKLHTPWKTYGLTPGQVVEFTMVATTVGQSEKALWSNFKKMLENSYWFKQYKAVCDEFGHKHGVRETIAANETFIKFKHKGVELYNASNDNKALRGSTRFGFAIDELAFFDEGVTAKTRSNGSETYTSLNNSLMTLRQRAVDLAVQDKGSLVPNPMGFCISSPRAMNDTMMQLFRDRKSDPKAVAMHLPTWKMNPTLPFKSPAMQKMLRQPNGWRDFGAQPPLTDNPLITRTGIVQEAFSTPLSVGATYGRIISPAATATQDDFQVASGRRMSNYVVANLDKDYKPPAIQKVSEEALAALGPYREVYEELLARPLSNRPHALGIDIGSTKCAMAICGLCLVGDRVVVDFLVEIKPTPQAAINLPYVFDELMIPLIEKLNVVGVFYDQWNSLHQIQKLTNLKGVLGPQNAPSEVRKWRAELKREESLPDFVAERVNLTVADANLLVSRLEQGDILFPAMERPLLDLVQDSSLVPEHTPYTHLALQMSTVRAVGNRLYKPSGGGDDDLFRAWAHVAIKAFTDDVVISLLKGETRKKSGNHNQNSAPLGYVSVGASGRGVKVIPVGAGGSPFAVVRRSGGGAGVKR